MDLTDIPSETLLAVLTCEQLNENRFAELGPDRALSRRRMISSYNIERLIRLELENREETVDDDPDYFDIE